jgi:hypothetical protein
MLHFDLSISSFIFTSRHVPIAYTFPAKPRDIARPHSHSAPKPHIIRTRFRLIAPLLYDRNSTVFSLASYVSPCFIVMKVSFTTLHSHTNKLTITVLTSRKYGVATVW